MYSKSFKQFIAKNKQIITTADIINYMEIDTYKLTASIILIPSFVTLPYTLTLYFYMLWSFFNTPFLYGCLVFLIFMLINFFFLSKYRYCQTMEQIYKDETIKKIIQTINNIENVKLEADEIQHIKKIYEKKNKEMSFYSDKRYINNVNSSLLWFAPIAMTIMTVYMYQYNYKETEIDVENIYTFLNIFIKINGPVRNIPTTLQSLYETYVSIKRIGNFLQCSDEAEGISYYEKNNIDLKNKGIMVQIDKGYFTWGKEKKRNNDIEEDKEKDNNNKNIVDTNENKRNNKNNIDEKNINEELNKEPLLPKNEREENNIEPDINQDNKELLKPINEGEEDEIINIKEDNKIDFFEESIMDKKKDDDDTKFEIVLKNINITINKGDLVVIYGKSGSGKTSLLEAILNQMKFIINNDNKFNVITNINGKTSYVSQIPFVYNSTVRQNISFDLSQEVKLNYKRYFNVIDICSLRGDLSELEGGDLTEIGENGINLSSGQIRRIAIARCLYAKKDIYLFDQPTFSIDKESGWKILYNGIFQFLKNKTRIVVTDKEEYAQYADKIIFLKNGEILFNGSYYELSVSNIDFKQEGFNFNFNNSTKEKSNENVDDNNNINSNANLNMRTSETIERTSSESSIKLEEEIITSSNALICHDLAKKVSQKALTYKTTREEKSSTYRYKLSTFSAPIPYLEGLKMIIITCFLIFEWQLTINGSDLWMVFWNNNQGHGLKKIGDIWLYMLRLGSLVPYVSI
jgi:ABC-type multidrug transport system fused ATPase/permease subunit